MGWHRWQQLSSLACQVGSPWRLATLDAHVTGVNAVDVGERPSDSTSFGLGCLWVSLVSRTSWAAKAYSRRSSYRRLSAVFMTFALESRSRRLVYLLGSLVGCSSACIFMVGCPRVRQRYLQCSYTVLGSGRARKVAARGMRHLAGCVQRAG